MKSNAAHLGSDTELDELRLQVVAEQALGLRWQILATALVVAAIGWGQVPTPLLFVWLLAVIGTREWRAAMLSRLVADRAAPVAERLARTVRSNALIGACNGSAALFMIWLDPVRDAVLTMILVSWGAGAVSTSATVIRAFVVYAALIFVPTAALWLWSGGAFGVAIAALTLMFFGVQWRFAQRNLETFDASFRIRRENETLTRSLQGEREQLSAARDAAVQANREKSRFLAAASHDLRQPLQAMALNVGALGAMNVGGEVALVVSEVAVSLERLRSMLDALLDLSKLDAGVELPQLGPVHLDRLLPTLTSGLRAVALEGDLALECRCPEGLVALSDARMLQRIVANLLDNAVKFTPPGGRVLLEAGAEGDGRLRIAVRDSGPGIAPEHHQLVFEDLVQFEPGTDRRPRGHGLGLGIVRRLTRLLEIDVGLESAPGSGATFSLRVPSADATDEEAEREAPAWSLAGHRVLVLDDDAMVRGAYANALVAMGCRCLTASTADEALALDARDAAEAAVVDVQLAGGRTGFDAVAALRQRHPALPVLMVSAVGDASLAEDARSLGVRLLRKPIDGQTLGRALAEALGRSATVC